MRHDGHDPTVSEEMISYTSNNPRIRSMLEPRNRPDESVRGPREQQTAPTTARFPVDQVLTESEHSEATPSTEGHASERQIAQILSIPKG